MRYVSTRGRAPELGFKDVLLTGLARDGGLYLPAEWPAIAPDRIRAFATMSYGDVALEVLAPFTGGEIARSDLAAMIDAATASFRHKAVTPLVQIEKSHYVLELFHGPTLAFKDVAMQLLGRMMDHVLTERDERATIVGATSGDTGGAAIEAFRGRERCDIFILFPRGRVSPVQQRQMTTASEANVHPIAIEGDFDDCQALVKGMFNDLPFRDAHGLSGVNSINWARIMPQIVYYFYAASRLGAPERSVSFTVPTGNFGDIFAGYAASRMGLPVERLVIATNANDILARTLRDGRYEMNAVIPTTSPSMDIQISSNFERLVFEATGRDSAVVSGLMDQLKQSRAFNLPEPALAAIRSAFDAGRASEEEVAERIARSLRESGYLADTHTAIGLHVAERYSNAETPMVTLSTAHPAKFPDAVEAACGTRPALPQWCGDLMDRDERFDVLPNSLDAVEEFISARRRAA